MRELNAINGLPDDVIYKEIVIIGNGPSGICMSYQLAGHWPVLKNELQPHPEAMLDARISNVPKNRPLTQQSLSDLSEGLEGRSHNPIPLLVDCLTNPGADIGSDIPAMLDWKYFPEKQIDHVVLGRGKPGGLWHTLDSSVVTLSPSRWMALPGYPSLADLQPQQRVPVPTVANYYQQYVNQSGIQKYFRNNTIVTSVKPVKLVGKGGCQGMVNPMSIKWSVCGYDTANKESFRYVCSKVVLATGAYDKPNTMQGTASSIIEAIRTPPRLRIGLDVLSTKLEAGNACPPIMIVGSGLSAADAILRARARGLSVAHSYRSPSAALRALPPLLYPEYHQVHQMMKDGVNGKYPLYTALPDYIIIEDDRSFNEKNEPSFYDEEENSNNFEPRTIKLLNTKTNEVKEMEVSFCVILIGSKPDLHFLPENFDSSYLTFNLDSDKFVPDILMNGNRRNGYSPQTNHQISNITPHPVELCLNCSYNSASKITHDSLCFFKTQWHNFKYIVGQGIHKTKNSKIIKSNDRNNVQEMSSSGDSIDSQPDQKTVEMKNNFNFACSMRGISNRSDSLNNINNGNENNKDDQIFTDSDMQCGGIGLGVIPQKPIDSRTNPIFIDKLSHAVQNAPEGLFALGPLAGDNFVRFIPGGALAIVSDIWNEKKQQNGQDYSN